MQLIEKGFLERYDTDAEGYQLPQRETPAAAQPERIEEPKAEKIKCISCNKLCELGSKYYSKCGQFLIIMDPPEPEEDTGLPEGVRKLVDDE